MTHQQRLLGQSALQAFRSDIVPGAPEAKQEDQPAIVVATLLRQSLAADDRAGCERLRDEAISMARTSLGDELSEGCTYDDHPSQSTTDVIRLLAQRTDRAGRLNLALHLLESAAEFEVDGVESGRILVDRARVTRKLGNLDLAFEQHQELLRHAHRLRSAELMAKAHHGLVALAQTRGNFVEFRSRLRTVVRIARTHRLRRMYAAAISGLGTSHSMAGRYGDAVAHFWKAFELCEGKSYIASTALGNLAQTLLVSGRPAEARKVATMLMQGAPVGTLAPLLGTFAVASAQMADHEGVRWAASQISALAESTGHAREIAEALMEGSAALGAIGDKPQAHVMKRRSEVMATQYGFHGLTFQEAMHSVRRLGEPLRFNSAGARATAAIDEIEVPRIPTLTAALSG